MAAQPLHAFAARLKLRFHGVGAVQQRTQRLLPAPKMTIAHPERCPYTSRHQCHDQQIKHEPNSPKFDLVCLMAPAT